MKCKTKQNIYYIVSRYDDVSTIQGRVVHRSDKIATSDGQKKIERRRYYD